MAVSRVGGGSGAAGGDDAPWRTAGGRSITTFGVDPDLADPKRSEESDSRPLRELPTYLDRVMLMPCLAWRISSL